MNSQSMNGGPTSLVVQNVPLAPAYVNPWVNIAATNITVSLPLTSGPQTFSSPQQNVGTLTNFANPSLLASLMLWYDYDPTQNIITFCSNDLISDDSTSLITTPAGTNQSCQQFTFLSDTTPCGTNPNWNYCTSLTPGLMQLMQQTVRTANQTIINAAMSQGYTVIVRTPQPTLSPEEYEKLCLVYHNGRFSEVYDPEKKYGEGYTITNLGSIWWGEIYLSAADNFVNVIGSTNDPKIASKSWLQLWQTQFGIVAASCSSLNYNGFVCGAGLVGGHVVLGPVATIEPAGSNKVFIMPICVAHNNNNSVDMGPVFYNKGIALHNYLN